MPALRARSTRRLARQVYCESQLLKSMNEESNRNRAAKQRCYGKGYQAKIGESRWQVEVHSLSHTRI